MDGVMTYVNFMRKKHIPVQGIGFVGFYTCVTNKLKLLAVDNLCTSNTETLSSDFNLQW